MSTAEPSRSVTRSDDWHEIDANALHEMKRRNVQFGVVSMCIGGGMGAAGVFELL